MKKLLFLCLLAFAPLSLAHADLKVAVIDLGKAFDSYYKTKDASAKLEAKAKTYQKELTDIVNEYQAKASDATKLRDQSNDPTLSAPARQDKANALRQMTQDLMILQNKIEEMKTEKTNEIQDERLRRHKDIVDDITKVVNAYATPQGYDLVLDKSSASAASGVPIVLFTSSKLTDITADVIKILNQNAPPAGAAGSAPAPAGSAPAPH